ncbi:MAG: phosphate acyltransferase PlsX [Pseudomonadota bacterium]
MDGTSSKDDAALPAKAGDTVVISIDAMGGDQGPATVVKGMARAAHKHPDLRFLLHGAEQELRVQLSKQKLEGVTTIRNAEGVVLMEDKPSYVMRHGKDTSMWSAIDSVRAREADVCVSCGNTGALMAVSMVRLRKLPGVNRPAIAVLWPSANTTGFNVMLDAGADIRADESDLMQYALMGASYARNGLSIPRPRVGLLNVGTEEHKGRAELKVAGEMIAAQAAEAKYEFVGFVEGGEVAGDTVDVIVTDGFTGNIALKTGEGTASFISASLRDAFRHTPLSRLAALMAFTSLNRLKKRIDPRRVNGGVFLGLNGTVVKSHGSADATGVAAAIDLAYELAKSGFSDRLAARVAQAGGFAPQEDSAR